MSPPKEAGASKSFVRRKGRGNGRVFAKVTSLMSMCAVWSVWILLVLATLLFVAYGMCCYADPGYVSKDWELHIPSVVIQDEGACSLCWLCVVVFARRPSNAFTTPSTLVFTRDRQIKAIWLCGSHERIAPLCISSIAHSAR